MKKSEINLTLAINLYNENGSLHKTANILHTSHIRLSKLFKENGVPIFNIGKARIISDSDIEKVLLLYNDNKTIQEISDNLHITIKKVSKILKSNNINTNRWRNHVKKEVIKTEKKIKSSNKEFKKCPYCEWITYDINNHSHAYPKHILQHDVDIFEHIKKFPDDEKFFVKMIKRREGKIQCKICGKYLSLIDDRHLSKHNISKDEYIKTYGNDVISDKCKKKLHNCIESMYNNPDWERFTSKYEKTLQTYLSEHNINFISHCRSLIHPNELDIYIPSKNTAIEFNGNKFHTEWFGGKTRQYHLNKTKECIKKDVKLIHIFEDEFHNSKEIVFNKISHILGIQNDLPKIYGRRCVIKEVDRITAELFLSKYHIQGYDPSTIHYGAYYNNELIAVMSFLKSKKGSTEWELTRFASDYNYICCGVGGKLFKHFIREHNPKYIKSFADRRWTVDEENNIYCQLGFKFIEYTKPDYKYYNPLIDKYKRFHKFGFRKQILLKKHPDLLKPEMTETEMAKELGYDRIWDCGLIKYVWTNEG